MHLINRTAHTQTYTNTHTHTHAHTHTRTHTIRWVSADDGYPGQACDDELLEGCEVEVFDSGHQQLQVLQSGGMIVGHGAVHLRHAVVGWVAAWTNE